MKILVGCPVLLREWSLPDWFDHLDDAADYAGVDLEFVFVGAPWDTATWDAIRVGADGRRCLCVHVAEDRRTPDRDWRDPARYHRMVVLRNMLLATVRAVGPEWFLSLDSDIMLHRDALANVVETSTTYGHAATAAGVNLRATAPNYFVSSRRGHGYERPAAPGVVTAVEVIMAAKLMSPAAYSIDYEWHRQGEDIGWSQAVRAAGHTLGWDNRAPSRHVADRFH